MNKQELRHRVREIEYLCKNYFWARSYSCPHKMLISIVDNGRFYNGGLADRFKGEISSYAWCKSNGYDFRIKYDFPFRLEDYLQPAKYNWLLKENEMSHCMRDVRIMYASGEMGRRMIGLKTRKQIHYWGNMNYLHVLNEAYGTDYSWGELFLELFKPTAKLQNAIDDLKAKINCSYNAAVFRFQNLLGDFREYSYEPLPLSEQQELLMRCIKGLQDLLNKFPNTKFLVTSDSSKFLEVASKLDRVFIIPGKIVHCGTVEGEDFDVYMKSFVDFYMISEAKSVYCVGTSEMYPSEFPMYAAKLNDVNFERILL